MYLETDSDARQLTSGYTGPTKQGVLPQPTDADQLSELLAEAVVRGRGDPSEPVMTLYGEPTRAIDRTSSSVRGSPRQWVLITSVPAR
jgi:hypothetical protein